jgi:hypothetical protein
VLTRERFGVAAPVAVAKAEKTNERRSMKET